MSWNALQILILGAPRRRMISQPLRQLVSGLLFLSPNILGFVTFTLLPLVVSFVMAFSNWDLKLHNMFRNHPVEWVGVDNFTRLAASRDFRQFLGNTLFFMMGLPLTIAVSLAAAMMLSSDVSGSKARRGAMLTCTILCGIIPAMLIMLGAYVSGTVALLTSIFVGIFAVGTAGGSAVYRTLFFIPNFTSGVATMLLWRTLYNPTDGVINNLLEGPLRTLTSVVRDMPSFVIQSISWGFLTITMIVFMMGLRRCRRFWADGEIGWVAAASSLFPLILPLLMTIRWLPLTKIACVALLLVAVFLIGRQFSLAWHTDRTFLARGATGIGSALLISSIFMVGEFVLVGLATIFWNLPMLAALEHGLSPPKWLADYDWAKPSIMIMMFWAAVGSGNMLLYIAALTNVPIELYEASKIDGASGFQRFWFITWPQLAPTTLFVVVMGVIGGLQSGFDTARVMTGGGPAGATTTLSYMIYQEGFETGRLGYSSAVAWLIFSMVLVVTIFNWKLGKQYVNE